MKICTMWPLAVGAAGFVLLGCGSSGGASSGYVPKKAEVLKSASVAPGQEATYFPFAVGNQWSYDKESVESVGNQQKQANHVVVYKLVGLKPSPGGGQDASFDVLTDDKMTSHEIWRMESSGLYQVAMGTDKPLPITPPQLVVPFPATKDRTYKWTGTATAQGGSTATSINGTVAGEQTIDTSKGDYNALAVVSTGKVSSSAVTSQNEARIWLIPGVGIGRFRLEVAGTIKNPKVKSPIPFHSLTVLKLREYSLTK